MQTFLVVKGRNLQLSNKSLRLDPLCYWLRRATCPTRYEHELYAVVYSLVLPLYQQQTTLGLQTSLSLLCFDNILRRHVGADIYPIFNSLKQGSSGQSSPLRAAAFIPPPPGGNKTATGRGKGASQPA